MTRDHAAVPAPSLSADRLPSSNATVATRAAIHTGARAGGSAIIRRAKISTASSTTRNSMGIDGTAKITAVASTAASAATRLPSISPPVMSSWTPCVWVRTIANVVISAITALVGVNSRNISTTGITTSVLISAIRARSLLPG
ncbi:MAG: hypothetical protein HWD60_08915 [Defluviicoccus sp.]|nr:MAG: hypothetical protein HWD60_08915 [Defluviicoccus sp.]